MRAALLLNKFKLSSRLQGRCKSTKVQFKLVDEVEKSLNDAIIKPRKHPGIIKNKLIELPPWIIEAMRINLEDITDQQQFNKECLKLYNYLYSRRLPVEENEMNKKYYEIETEMLENKLDNLDEEQIEIKRKQIKGVVHYKLKQKVFAWKAMQYNRFRALLYMSSRSAAEYSAIYTIFNEIKRRDPDFVPRTMFDFGAGVGTVLWAGLEHWKSIIEYLAVDISNDMNDLSENIISYSPSKFKGSFYRQYLPVSNLKHDIIVSAYSLMDLPNAKSRLEVISKLWRKTGKYLVIIEQGSLAGFKLINECKDFIKYIMNNVGADYKYYTFAPCPHDLECPRYREGTTPCNFLCQYKSVPLFGSTQIKQELYSYVVIKKGERSEDDNWYRLVRMTVVRSKHTRCHLCTSEGNLKEVVFTASKHGKHIYKCATKSRWGDRLPIQPICEMETSINTQEQKLELQEENLNCNDETKQKNEIEKFSSKAPFVIDKN